MEEAVVRHDPHVVTNGRLSKPESGGESSDKGAPVGAVDDQPEQLHPGRVGKDLQAPGDAVRGFPAGRPRRGEMLVGVARGNGHERESNRGCDPRVGSRVGRGH